MREAESQMQRAPVHEDLMIFTLASSEQRNRRDANENTGTSRNRHLGYVTTLHLSAFVLISIQIPSQLQRVCQIFILIINASTKLLMMVNREFL